MDPTKINSIMAFPQPTSIKKLQSFLSLINFSLRFVPNLAVVTASLRRLLAKGTDFLWSNACQESFTKLRTLVQQVSTLAHLDFSHPFNLQTDALDQGLGTVLLQENQEN